MLGDWKQALYQWPVVEVPRTRSRDLPQFLEFWSHLPPESSCQFTHFTRGETKAPQACHCRKREAKGPPWLVQPVLPGPYLSFTALASLICHLQHFWLIFQGHPLPEAWLHCTCSTSLSKCPWKTSQSLDSVAVFCRPEILPPSQA